MYLIDWHCDALSKLAAGKGKLDFRNAPAIDANLERLKRGGVKVQCFAVFIDPEVPVELKYEAALEQISYFHREVIGNNPDVKQILNWNDFFSLQDGEIGAMLTLEGADPIGNDLGRLEIFYQLGVRSIGLTWNHANLCADGAGEPRGAGLTAYGRDMIEQMNRRKMLADVSHLSEQAFWDVMSAAEYPFASHSNARALCDHPRNLSDDQVIALFEKGGMVHVVFYPEFIQGREEAEIGDLIRHIDHLVSLGGLDKIGFGSDFDGIDYHVNNLEHAGKYENLINELLKKYSYNEVLGFAGRNFYDFCVRKGLL
ncbi:dipeptidase [Aciduricibacillus chroicocephali]|uniref:Dipeptidase n=1 Tax=Aciduricibacillus chroicocephali TaxID=3054939 RepID=A0ABY9KX02_9BACI|nr:dipeptidase [Bacillaceae bacterium 44XB]